MADYYSQFSEVLPDITPEEKAWVDRVLQLKASEEEEALEELKKELALEGDQDFDCWPQFDWEWEDNGSSLWLHSEEYVNIDHLSWFIQALINKFRPELIFKATGAETCSRPQAGQFGGWWLVVSKDQVLGGNTWHLADEAVKKLKEAGSGS